MASKKQAKAPLTEDQQQTFAEAEKASKQVQPSETKSRKQPKETRELGNGAVRKDW